MSSIKKLGAVIIAVAMMMQVAPIARGETPAELQAQVNQLAAQLQALQSATPAYVFTRNLRIGMRGDDVKKLQQFLLDEGYLKISGTTNYFGAQTKAALGAWQRANEIRPAVGFFGALTRAAVNSKLATPSMTPGGIYIFTRQLMRGSRGGDVAKLQEFLKKKGFLDISEYTTYFGAQTKAALIAWQRANGITLASGALDDVTRAAINAEMVREAGVQATNPTNPQYTATSTVTVPTTPTIPTYQTGTSTAGSATSTVGAATSTMGMASSTEISITTPTSTTVGAMLSIKFTSRISRRVNISLCNEGLTCTTINPAFTASTGNNSYLWTVPSTVVPGKHFVKIALTGVNEGGVSQLFTIGAQVVRTTTYGSSTSTAGVGSAFQITQPATTTVGSSLKLEFTNLRGATKVHIYLCKSSTDCTTTIVSEHAVTSGANTYSWTVPASVTPGNYYIKIVNASNPGSYTVTARTFAIAASSSSSGDGGFCSTKSGTKDYKTTCGFSKALISGLCFYRDNPTPVPGTPHVWWDGIGVYCTPSNTSEVKLYCCGF